MLNDAARAATATINMMFKVESSFHIPLAAVEWCQKHPLLASFIMGLTFSMGARLFTLIAPYLHVKLPRMHIHEHEKLPI